MMTDVSSRMQEEVRNIKRVSSGQFFTLNPTGSLQTKLMASSVRNSNDQATKSHASLRMSSHGRSSSSAKAFLSTGAGNSHGFGFNESQNQVGAVNHSFMNNAQKDGSMAPFQFQPTNKVVARNSDFKMSMVGEPSSFSSKVDSRFEGKWNQSRAHVMQNPTEDISKNLKDINRHNFIKSRAARNDIKMSIASDKNAEELFGKPQKDPEDPTVTGDTNFEKNKDYMDQMFFNDQMFFYEEEGHRELLINTEKLTRGRFNITVPLRDPYINDQFLELGLANDLENRERFYEMIYSTPNLGQYTSGAILTDELIRHPDQKFQKILKDNYLIIGRRIDAQTTLEDLETIAKEYYDLGCRFAVIRQDISHIGVIEASRQLAKKAKICQDHGIVPIVRPVLNEYPTYNLEQIETFFNTALQYLMDMMKEEDVLLEGAILCVGTVTSFSETMEFSAEDRAFFTARSLSRFVPTAIGGIIVNSTNDEERENIDALALQKLKQFKNPWRISARVGQRVIKATLNVWNGQDENSRLAQDTFRCLLKNMYHQYTVSQQVSKDLEKTSATSEQKI